TLSSDGIVPAPHRSAPRSPTHTLSSAAGPVPGTGPDTRLDATAVSCGRMPHSQWRAACCPGPCWCGGRTAPSGPSPGPVFPRLAVTSPPGLCEVLRQGRIAVPRVVTGGGDRRQIQHAVARSGCERTGGGGVLGGAHFGDPLRVVSTQAEHLPGDVRPGPRRPGRGDVVDTERGLSAQQMHRSTGQVLGEGQSTHLI